jgi:hypothetical protein
VAEKSGIVHGYGGFLDRRQRGRDVLRGTTAVAGDDRGDAHPNEVLGQGMVGNLVRVRVHVDKTRSDDQAFRLDDRLRGCARQRADRGDPSTADSNVDETTWRASAINNDPATDERVERLDGQQRCQ